MDEAWLCHRRLLGAELPRVRDALCREYDDWLALAMHDHAERVRTFRRRYDDEASAPGAPPRPPP
jgi:hypothetical protein